MNRLKSSDQHDKSKTHFPRCMCVISINHFENTGTTHEFQQIHYGRNQLTPHYEVIEDNPSPTISSDSKQDSSLHKKFQNNRNLMCLKLFVQKFLIMRKMETLCILGNESCCISNL